MFTFLLALMILVMPELVFNFSAGQHRQAFLFALCPICFLGLPLICHCHSLGVRQSPVSIHGLVMGLAFCPPIGIFLPALLKHAMPFCPRFPVSTPGGGFFLREKRLHLLPHQSIPGLLGISKHGFFILKRCKDLSRPLPLFTRCLWRFYHQMPR